MPYINQKERERILKSVRVLSKTILTDGQLNFAVTALLQEYFDANCYEDMEAVVGLLECVKLEFYRRVAAPYEDKKREEHGDVF